MKRSTAFSFAALCLLPLASRIAHTDGCMMPTEDDWKRRRERSLILEPDQKALLYFRAGREQLIISPNYAGESSRFAWVVPVPSRPRVEILKGAPFHELARLAEPAPPRLGRMDSMAGGKSAAPAGVTVIERKKVGDYDVSVLSSTDSKSLLTWLKENRYHLPERAAGPIQEYIKEGWTFVASKIKPNDSARGLKTGTLTPLKLTFSTENPVYPMRLSAANAQPFNVLLYVAQPLRAPAALREVSAPGNPGSAARLQFVDFAPGQRAAFPTLAGLNPDGLHVGWMKINISPKQCDRDFVWSMERREIQ